MVIRIHHERLSDHSTVHDVILTEGDQTLRIAAYNHTCANRLAEAILDAVNLLSCADVEPRF